MKIDPEILLNLHNSNKPIFIQGMMGGGTGIIWNLIQSHPACSGIKLETNEALSCRFRDFLKSIYRNKPVFSKNAFKLLELSARYRISPNQFNRMRKRQYEVPDLNEFYHTEFIKALDEHLYKYKMEKIFDPVDKYKYPWVKYTIEELKNTRLVAKNNETLCLTADWFRTVYPSSKFISIVRNCYVVCESQLRHKRTPNAGEIAKRWSAYVQKMIDQRKKEPANFYILKYEDLVQDPYGTIKSVYRFLGLDFTQLKSISIHIRNFLGKQKTFMKGKATGNKYWIDLKDLKNFLQPDINKRSLNRLTAQEILRINRDCESVMQTLGYDKIG